MTSSNNASTARPNYSSGFNPVDLGTLAEPPPLKYIVEGIVPSGETTNLYGDGGQGKSTVANWLAQCVVQGKSFLGKKTLKGKVLILDWELNTARTTERMFNLARGIGLTKPPGGIMYEEMVGPLEWYLPSILSWCNSKKPVLVILDSFVGASGDDPMSQAAAIKVMENLKKIPAARLIIDHQSNPSANARYDDKRPFGGAYKFNLARSVMQLERVAEEPGKVSAKLRQTKNNFGSLVSDINFHIIFEPSVAPKKVRLELAQPGATAFQKPRNKSQEIEHFIMQHGPCTLTDITTALTVKDKTVQNTITRLRKDGRMPKRAPKNHEGKTLYELSPDDITI